MSFGQIVIAVFVGALAANAVLLIVVLSIADDVMNHAFPERDD